MKVCEVSLEGKKNLLYDVMPSGFLRFFSSHWLLSPFGKLFFFQEESWFKSRSALIYQSSSQEDRPSILAVINQIENEYFDIAKKLKII